MVNFNNIFLQKTGQMDALSPWDDTRITGFLDNSAYLSSKNFSTPWVDFASVPETYQYSVTLFAAIEYWWAKAGEYASKFDIQTGGNISSKSTQLFYRALEMVNSLKKELAEVAGDLLDAGAEGDIIMGQLVVRSKESGYLVPRSDDPVADWTS